MIIIVLAIVAFYSYYYHHRNDYFFRLTTKCYMHSYRHYLIITGTQMIVIFCDYKIYK